MKVLIALVIIIVVLAVGFGLYLMGAYNGLVQLRKQVEQVIVSRAIAGYRSQAVVFVTHNQLRQINRGLGTQWQRSKRKHQLDVTPNISNGLDPNGLARADAGNSRHHTGTPKILM